jgi:cytochrome P450
MLLMAQDEDDGTGMTDEQVRDEVMTIFLAGHETTATALTWVWYLLSQHPEVETRLHDELDRVLGDRAPGLADLPQLKYVEMVVKETMRLYPPAWNFGRQPVENIEIGGYTIRKGSTVFISPYVMHHHPRYFEDPETFDPERFSPENEARITKFSYIPFGAGPRVCIGNSFAMMEAQLILATMAQRCRLSLLPGQEVALEALVTLRPRDEIRMVPVSG